MDFKNYRYLEQKCQLIIVHEPLSRWVGALDVSSADGGPPTLLWSLLAGTPKIAFDWLKLADTTQEVGIGKVMIESPQEHKQTLNRLTFDDAYREELRQADPAVVGIMSECLSGNRSSESVIGEIT